MSKKVDRLINGAGWPDGIKYGPLLTPIGYEEAERKAIQEELLEKPTFTPLLEKRKRLELKDKIFGIKK